MSAGCPHFPKCQVSDWISERAKGYTDTETFDAWCRSLDDPPEPSPIPPIILIDKRTGQVVR